jgi:hypothetical protein
MQTCENFIRRINAAHQELPLLSWMNLDIQFIIEQEMIIANIPERDKIIFRMVISNFEATFSRT